MKHIKLFEGFNKRPGLKYGDLSYFSFYYSKHKHKRHSAGIALIPTNVANILRDNFFKGFEYYNFSCHVEKYKDPSYIYYYDNDFYIREGEPKHNPVLFRYDLDYSTGNIIENNSPVYAGMILTLDNPMELILIDQISNQKGLVTNFDNLVNALVEFDVPLPNIDPGFQKVELKPKL